MVCLILIIYLVMNTAVVSLNIKILSRNSMLTLPVSVHNYKTCFLTKVSFILSQSDDLPADSVQGFTERYSDK
jgi:hypothetical protein